MHADITPHLHVESVVTSRCGAQVDCRVRIMIETDRQLVGGL